LRRSKKRNRIFDDGDAWVLSGQMARRRRQDPLEKRVSAVVGFVGLIVTAYVFSPGLRAAFNRFLVAFVIGLGGVLIVLIGWVIFRYLHKKREEEFASSYLGNEAPTDRPGSAALRAVKSAVARTEGEVETAPQSAVFADGEFWRGRLEGEVSDEFPQQGHFASFSQELLDALEWRRFEQLVTWYFQKTGFEARRSRVGADGGVDIHVFNRGVDRPFAYVQCKAWYAYKVGVKPIRELFGVMAADRISTGYFITTGGFSAEAHDFAKGRDMKLITGGYLLEKLNSLPESDRSDILQHVTAGDYRTPTCPRCDVKMVRRTGSDGDFWGCPNYSRRPSCRQTFKLRLV
jgi:Restriction endonuclease